MTSQPSAKRLRDIAAFVRSKNAGPFVLTIDIFFASAADCAEVIKRRALTPEVLASLYGLPADDIRIIHVSQANALKVSMPRPIPAGDIGENDVAGGQQFAPILDVPVRIGGDEQQ